MQQVLDTEAKPIKLWLSDIEAEALAQARNLANLPFTWGHVAVMADAHPGYGMPIGSVLATKGVVVPNAVGVDIGCGMCAVRTSLTRIDQDQLKRILGSREQGRSIRGRIPLGFKHHDTPQDPSLMPDTAPLSRLKASRVLQLFPAACKQLGTLGGGNHFIEIQQGDDGYVWLMIHSGSRNLGLQVARHYNTLARGLNRRWYSAVPEKWDLAFLPLDIAEGWAYLREMEYCVAFAQANRLLMMRRVQEAIAEVVPAVEFGLPLHVAHNYAALEHHRGEDLVIHRKGATRAREGEHGIIPGSQGTSSYIVRGLGNPDSFHSCSHGAGRVMGRKQAQRSLDLAAEQERLDRLGIVHGLRGTRDLDEAPGAYKDIRQVMANQQDLVRIEVCLRPLAVIKG
jgi:tRNA-splicing ligase RtcB (3'-phosphate/5'-hydroxy nucleic acid ligase)